MSRSFARVLGVPITHRSLDAATAGINACASSGRGGYLCLANVHMIMEALDDPSFFDVLDHAEAVVPDGMPLVWSLRADGYREAERVAGIDLTTAVLELAQERGLAVGFFGGQPEVLERLLALVRSRWPKVRVAYAYSPPFRAHSESEVEQQIQEINSSGVPALVRGPRMPQAGAMDGRESGEYHGRDARSASHFRRPFRGEAPRANSDSPPRPRVALPPRAGAAKAPLEIRAPQSAVRVETCHRESRSAAGLPARGSVSYMRTATTSADSAVSPATVQIAASIDTASAMMPATSAPTAKPLSRQLR